MPSVYEGAVPNVFQSTLGAIWTSVLKDNEPYWKGYLEEGTTDKRWFDDVEWVDPGLWSETDEGGDIDLDDYSEGTVTRYRPIKFAKRLIIPVEIEEDAVYEEAYAATEMMARTFVQTQDYYAVGIIDDAANANVVGGDGVILASASHPIKGGSTYSNILNPALTPSNTSLQLVLVAAKKLAGSNGYIAGVRVTGWAGPTNLMFRFDEILKSEKRDDTTNNAINALRSRKAPDMYNDIPHMASTTNWFAKTDAQRGARFIWRKRPTFKKAPEIKIDATTHVGRARFLTGYSNPRTFFFSLA